MLEYARTPSVKAGLRRTNLGRLCWALRRSCARMALLENEDRNYHSHQVRALSRNMYSAPSLPWMVSLRGRCLEVITCSCGANAAMVTTGSPAMYVPGTASSRPCAKLYFLECTVEGDL